MTANRKTLFMLIGIGLAMLALGFASKPLYDTFCKVTGYGGTTRYAEENLSEILDRKVTVSFDEMHQNVSHFFPPLLFYFVYILGDFLYDWVLAF